jgi:hypothetical protein
MVEQDLLHLSINGYQLGSRFCRKELQRGGVCIFVKKDQHFSKINISPHCKEQEMEICAIQLVTKSVNLIILGLYRAPSGDVHEFLKRLDAILKCLYSPKSEFLICGDINYLNEDDHKQKINSLLKTYNLSHTVNFPTRVQNSSSTAIDNIFINTARLSSSYTSPTVNGLSDHDTQFLTISDIASEVKLVPMKWRFRKINNLTIAQFQCLLANETWKPVFKYWDTNHKFNSFLDMFLKNFEASFPLQNKSLGKTRNDWITEEIKISCRHKRSLYIHSRSNNPHMRAHYNESCKILTRVIKETKRQHYYRLIEKSDKIKATWNIIKHESGKLYPTEQISSVLITKNKVNDSQKNCRCFQYRFFKLQKI